MRSGGYSFEAIVLLPFPPLPSLMQISFGFFSSSFFWSFGMVTCSQPHAGGEEFQKSRSPSSSFILAGQQPTIYTAFSTIYTSDKDRKKNKKNNKFEHHETQTATR